MSTDDRFRPDRDVSYNSSAPSSRVIVVRRRDGSEQSHPHSQQHRSRSPAPASISVQVNYDRDERTTKYEEPHRAREDPHRRTRSSRSRSRDRGARDSHPPAPPAPAQHDRDRRPIDTTPTYDSRRRDAPPPSQTHSQSHSRERRSRSRSRSRSRGRRSHSRSRSPRLAIPPPRDQYQHHSDRRRTHSRSRSRSASPRPSIPPPRERDHRDYDRDRERDSLPPLRQKQRRSRSGSKERPFIPPPRDERQRRRDDDSDEERDSSAPHKKQKSRHQQQQQQQQQQSRDRDRDREREPPTSATKQTNSTVASQHSQQIEQELPQHDGRHPAIPSSCLMFRNLSFQTTESTLLASFTSLFPTLKPHDLRIIRDRTTQQSRGIAFVDLPSVEDAIQVFETTKGKKWTVDGKTVYVAYGSVKEGRDRPAAAAVAPPISDWDCPRCSSHNSGHADQCSLCNIPRIVVEHGEDAMRSASVKMDPMTAALTGYQPHTTHLSAHMMPPAGHTSLLGASASAATTSDIPEPLIEAISNSKVLFLSGLLLTTSLDTVRERFLPYTSRIHDVLFPVASHGSITPLGYAFVRIERPKDCKRLHEKLSEEANGILKIDEVDVRIELASATHFQYATKPQLSWLESISLTAKQRFTSAVDAASLAAVEARAAAGRKNINKIDWQRVVSEQAAVYADSLPPNTMMPSNTTTLPPRPPELAATFLFDMSSGLWHDSATGYYYNAAKQVYYNGHTQSWSRWDAGSQQYVQTDEHGQLLPSATQGVSLVAAQYLVMKAAHAHAAALAAANNPPPAATTTISPSISFSFKSSTAAAAIAARKAQPEAVTATATTASTPPAAVVAPSAPAPLLTNVSSAAVAITSTPSFLDPTRLACLLCQRQMKSLDLLLKHEQQSQLHKDNLAAWHAKQGGSGAMIQSQMTAPATTDQPPPPIETPPAMIIPASQPVSTPAPAPTPALTPAEIEYRRQMAQFRVLDHEETKRPMLK